MTAIRVLVTGFGPWGSIDENPTALVLDRLRIGPGVSTLLVPVDSSLVDGLVQDALDRYRPALWIGLGLAMGAAVVAVERVAVNLRDFGEPDIAGRQLREASVVDGGPAAYAATWPVVAIVRRLRADAIPARASNTAGAFLCNQLMYTVLHEVATRGLATRVGFLHVPAHPALVARQTGKAAEHPSMEIDRILAAVEGAIDTTLNAP